MLDDAELDRLFHNARFPRASRYPGRMVALDQMGPNALHLTEWLVEGLPLDAGMQVLDLGCGRALSSIFLAREIGCRVVAADLWVRATDNLERLRAAGVADRVLPLEVEAHALPFAEGQFDAIVSLDAYTYFGTDDLYLGYVARFLAPGGRLGIVVPGLVRELTGPPPPALTEPQANGAVFWEPDAVCFHGAAWWRTHWSKTGLVAVEDARILEDGWRHWAAHEEAVAAAGTGVLPSYAEAIRRDGGQTLALVRAVARLTAALPRGPHPAERSFQGVVADLVRARDERLGRP